VHFVLPENGILIPQHVGNTPLLFIYVINNVHLVGAINRVHCNK